MSVTILVPQGGIGAHHLKVNIQVQYKKNYFNNSKNFAYKLGILSCMKKNVKKNVVICVQNSIGILITSKITLYKQG